MAGPGPQAPAHQQPLLVQLAEVRARLESGKRKLAEAEIEMQAVAKRVAAIRSDVDAAALEERRLVEALAAAGGGVGTTVEAVPGANGAAPPAPQQQQQQQQATTPRPPQFPLGVPVPPGMVPPRAPYAPMAIQPATVMFNPAGGYAIAPVGQPAPSPARRQLQPAGPGAMLARPPHPAFPVPAAAGQRGSPSLNPSSSSLRGSVGAREFVPRAVAMQGQQVSSPPQARAVTAPATPGSRAVGAAAAGRPPPGFEQQLQQHPASQGPLRPADKSPLAAFPMPGQKSRAPAAQAAPPAAPPPPQADSGAAAAAPPPPLQQPQQCGEQAGPGEAPVAATVVAALEQAAARAGTAESVEDLNAAMEAAALASTAEAEQAAALSAPAAASGPPQQQRSGRGEGSRKERSWGRGSGGGGGGAQQTVPPGSSATPVSPRVTTSQLEERSEAEEAAEAAAALLDSYDALLAGSYEDYVRSRQAPGPDWAAPEQVEQDFPSLGGAAGPAPKDPAAANGGSAWGSKWGSGSLREKLAAGSTAGQVALEGAPRPQPARRRRPGGQRPEQAWRNSKCVQGCGCREMRPPMPSGAGIIPLEVVEPMPPLLRALCRRLTRWGAPPAAREPNSAIVNIYEAGDCIPPHVDHHDFLRPFCTISLLSEQHIVFAQKLVPAGPGEFVARDGCSPIQIPLPTGSCCVLKGYGGDTAMHCVPPVAARRISVTLRRIGPKHAPAVAREVERYERHYGPLDLSKLGSGR